MSTMDALRAMREANYARSQAARPATSSSTPRVAPAVKAPARTTTKAVGAEPAATDATEALCGHQNISGRRCTREQGHSAKSHRYS